jgi:AAA+ superfamily predicted ATPase
VTGGTGVAFICSMKLVFLYGAPGRGKLTTARALRNRVNGRLFDNHAAIDVARMVFDFGAPGFWELVQTVRTSSSTRQQNETFRC